MRAHWPTADQQPGITPAGARVRLPLAGHAEGVVLLDDQHGGGTPFFTVLDKGEPDTGGDPVVSRRRAPDQVRDQALSTRAAAIAGL